MIRTTIVALAALACTLGAQVRKAPDPEAQALALQDLVAKMKAGEKGVTSVYLEVVTRAPFPSVTTTSTLTTRTSTVSEMMAWGSC